MSEAEGPAFPGLRSVSAGAPLSWIAAGWADLRAAPGASLFYGGAFAMLVIAVSVISIPLMMVRGTDTISAMIPIFLALARNFPALLIWALLIVTLTFAGMASLYAGLAVTAPLIGHATWHAYRALVAPAQDNQLAQV